MSRIGRWLLPQLAQGVTRERALELARRSCEEQGVPWHEPVKVYRHYGDWAVWTYAGHRGGNVRVIIDGGSGDVKRLTGPTLR
jgi:hypothetical protein